MRSPKGFGKQYFTLTAILAYAVAPKLHTLQIRYTFVHKQYFLHHEDGEEEEPLEAVVPTATSCLQSTCPCHCNCYFRARALLLLKLVRQLPKCNCKCRFFSFRRTGTHPPKLSFF